MTKEKPKPKPRGVKPKPAPAPTAAEPNPSMDLGPGIVPEVGRLDQSIIDAINSATQAGLAQGFIVAVLHAHAQRQTQLLMG